jgi:hypothetical protein
VRYSLFEYSATYGLGIYHSSTDPDVTVEYCTFRNNYFAGIYVR